MARTVREIMNPELFTISETTRTCDALDALLEMNITAAPVVDADRRPTGMTSLRDLVRNAKSCLSAPARSIDAAITIEDAARIMAEGGTHHLVVVGTDGRVVGIVSSFDLLRALLGMPPQFPATFPHRDAGVDATWTDLASLDLDHLASAPEGAGVLVLTTGGALQTEADVWAESADALRDRVRELIQTSQRGEPALARLLCRHDIRYRCAHVSDPVARERLAHRLRARIEQASYPRDGVPAEG